MSESNKRYARRSQATWQSLILDFRQSKLSAKAYCEQHNIGYASFCHWRKRLLEPEQTTARNQTQDTGFIDLSSLSQNDQSSWKIILKLGDGMELSLSRD